MEIRRDIFTCIGKGVKTPAVPATRQEWERMRRMPWLKEMCERIEKHSAVSRGLPRCVNALKMARRS